MSYKSMAELAKQNRTARDLMPAFFQFKQEDDTIIGRFVSRSTITSKKNAGTYADYVFDTDDGRVHFACGDQFDKKCGDELKAGGVYQIIFKGKQAVGGGRTVNQFTVYEIPGVPADQLPLPGVDNPF
jgi:hypothetical protein